MTLRPEANGGPWRELVPPVEHSPGFVQALFSGGDSRIAADPRTGLNKYLCPTVPTSDLLSVSSCTASPVSVRGFARAAAAFSDVVREPSPQRRARRLTNFTEAIEARLLRYFGVGALARVILCPSGTDALLTTAMLIAAEQTNGVRGKAITAVLPSASETGTGVPMAAVCRVFDGPDRGAPLTECAGTTVEIPLRSADGSPHCEDAVNHAFAAATAAAAGRVIVYLTHGTKTGLIAPMSPPDGADVIVDACQARIEPQTVAAYLGRGWPVIVTGSKFFGGPAFSGAVLFPRARLAAIERRPLPAGMLPSGLYSAANLGTALRWTAAMAEIDAFEPLAAGMAGVLSDRVAAIEQALASNPALVPVSGLPPRGSGWADLPSIFTFGVRDPTERRRLLSAAELRPLYEHLAHIGILLGQPVDLGQFGGLRIAIGARDLLPRDLLGDLLDGPGDGGLARVFAALAEATAPSRGLDSGR